ncbi:hypothetical protein ACFPN0_04880 [Kitasatospora cinereorecta]
MTVTKTGTVTAPPPKPKGPPTTVEGDGEYLVGEDMKAGTQPAAWTRPFTWPSPRSVTRAGSRGAP